MNYGINEMIATYDKPRHKRIRPRNRDTHLYSNKSKENYFKKIFKKL